MNSWGQLGMLVCEKFYVFFWVKKQVFCFIEYECCIKCFSTEYAIQEMELSVDCCYNGFYFQIHFLKVLKKKLKTNGMILKMN